MSLIYLVFHYKEKGKYVSDDSFSFLVIEKNHFDVCFLELKFYHVFSEKRESCLLPLQFSLSRVRWEGPPLEGK